ncbi:MAG TPA: cell envelope integrity protein TolA [Spongiibacteraceae bacterium]|nr:cell envelope integrity protein TolA [Spongiibacteraceae bacterium]
MARPVAVPLTISLLLHAAILALLAFNFKFAPEPKILPPQPNIIEATLVRLDAIPSAKPAPAPKPVEAPPQPIVDPAPKPEPPKPVEPPKPELSKPEPVKPTPPVVPTKPEAPKPDLEKQKQIEKQKLLEKEQADAAKKAEQQKQEAERTRKQQEAQRKEQEQQEVQRKKQQEDLARKQREQAEKAALAKAMAAEEDAMAAANSQEAITSYQAVIQRAVQNNWSRPPSARVGMKCILMVQLIPTGEVVDVQLVKSSGDDAFDRSAITAVKKAGQFPELKNLKPAEFEKNFRRLTMPFTPEDLRQ